MIVKIKTRKNVSYLTTLKSGHLYKDDKGCEFIFLGFGKLKDISDEPEVFRSTNDLFFYIKKSQLMENFKKRILTMEMTKYNENHLSKENFYSILNHSARPRHFVEDLGEFFPSEMFRSFIIKDYSYSNTEDVIIWKLETIEVL